MITDIAKALESRGYKIVSVDSCKISAYYCKCKYEITAFGDGKVTERYWPDGDNKDEVKNSFSSVDMYKMWMDS